MQPPSGNDHAMPPPLQNATRYLSAGAYLDDRFRDRVLNELLGDPHRAVAPSYGGWDLTPVLSHCLRAQRMVLVRDALITVSLFIVSLFVPVLFTGFWTVHPASAGATVAPPRPAGSNGLAGAAGPVGRPQPHLEPRRVTLRLHRGEPRLPGQVGDGLRPGDGTYVDSSPSILSLGGGSLFSLLSLLIPLIFAVGYRFYRYVALTTELRPGVPALSDGDTGQQQGRRAYLDQAQWGNITLFGTDNPFIGAGPVQRSWSIVVETDRLKHSDNVPSATPRQYVQIDPVDLHSFVKQRLLEMRDAVNTAPERITQMHVGDHLTARGTFTRLDWPGSGAPRRWEGQSHPLIDTASGLPHFAAPPETIADAAHQPQGSLKYYQRVTVGADGQGMISSNGSLLAPGEDREIVVSAFIHLAVEGRMLYTQFVLTVLPPIIAEYRIVDELPTLTRPALVWRTISRGKLNLIADTVFAPFRLIRTGIRAIQWQRETRNPAAFPVYPFGARESVRELGSINGLGGFIQRLDADKYTKLIERRLTEAVLDYLEAKNVDTREYRAQATSLISGGALITGGTFHGPIAVGTEASATQHGGDKVTQGNSGFQITGGTFNGPMAAGIGAQSVQHTNAPAGGDHTTELLALIRDLVRQHATELGEIRPVLRDADQVEAELQEETPDSDYLSSSLTRMAGRVASVTVIAEAVAALAALVSGT